VNEGLCKVSDFGCCVRGLVSTLLLFLSLLTVNVTKSPYFFEKQGVFSQKVGGFLGKGVGFIRISALSILKFRR